MNNLLSIVILTHNDESRLVDCLECLKFGDDLIIIDDNSQDRTVDIARKYTEKVFRHELKGNFAHQRNFALNLVHNGWVLFIDSDEMVSEKLKIEIMQAIKDKKLAGYYLRRVDYLWGKRILHGDSGEVRLLRLARKDAGKWHGKVHEKWVVAGITAELSNPLVHIPHQSVRDFINDINDYSTLRAEELKERGLSSNKFKIIIYPVAKFLLNYFVRGGYKDGIPGFLQAMIMSLHSFLVRAKLYQSINNE